MTPDGRITVLHLCEHFGGAEASLHGVARGFQWWIPNFDARRFRVLLCSRKGWDKAAEQMEKSGVRPLTLGYGKLDPRNLFRLLSLIRREQVDILHAHGYGACLWARLAGHLLRLPVIVHERCNYRTVPLLQRPVEFLLGPFTRYAFAVSESTRQFCIQHRYMRPEVVKTLYNGILLEDMPPADPAWIRQQRADQQVPDGARVIGVVGRIESHKGHLDALRALRRLVDEGRRVQLWVVGDGAFEPEVRRSLQELGLADHVRMLGFRKDARRVIRCFDVQLFPSHMEGTPNTLYEAMAAGQACVCSRIDGQMELLTEETSGLFFDAGDDAAMARQLARVLDDERLAVQLRAQVRERIKQFDGRRCLRTMEETYTRIMAERGRCS
jgi:glycosyltransferase involved in cell wall biosynthesis